MNSQKTPIYNTKEYRTQTFIKEENRNTTGMIDIITVKNLVGIIKKHVRE